MFFRIKPKKNFSVEHAKVQGECHTLGIGFGFCIKPTLPAAVRCSPPAALADVGGSGW